ncbi:Sugar-specific transcriptional regulator TrmB [Halalkaliarchaeum sp. AArc-CO]|uniref:TrmB family transcriptional regulator n=1 Tax=Halalkaliarchaeum sp. AArc-CO TaxID=2866381 RepID=UPI00217E0663|nr:TrmB family transcriptional regulator sugar-binding domain-containing protein [Halalkaliarchaeum sp. AArc-CO]UWG49821.1 Sugar-specific transcriptional regulator TrmB [Halalkaliarchaeum sp. AArc-CO]
MDESTLVDLLGRFGFSDKEIDTYLTLLAHGEATASQIADAAGVSKRYVYSVSETLEKRGFAEVNDHVVPTVIRANPPEQVIESLQRDVDAMLPGLKQRYAEVEPTADQFEVVKSRVTVLKRIRALIREAETELVLSLPIDHLPDVREELAAAVDRGVLVLLIVAGVDDQTELSETLPELNGIASVTRTWSEPMPTILAVDSRIGVLAPMEMLVRSNSDRQAIVFTQEQLGPVIVGSFLGNYWPVAEEVAVADPAPLPREFADFRHAVLQATRHLRAGTDLRASVEGRATEDDEPVAIEGRVVDVTQGLITPANNEFPVEHALTLETDDGTVVTVGGPGAFVEDVEASAVTLLAA